MALKKFCDDCGIEIDYAAESKADIDIELKRGDQAFTRRVSVEIDFGNEDLCSRCVWVNAALAAKVGVKNGKN